MKQIYNESLASPIDTMPPIGKQKVYSTMRLAYVYATEEAEPEGRPRSIGGWSPVSSFEEAVETPFAEPSAFFL